MCLFFLPPPLFSSFLLPFDLAHAGSGNNSKTTTKQNNKQTTELCNVEPHNVRKGQSCFEVCVLRGTPNPPLAHSPPQNLKPGMGTRGNQPTKSHEAHDTQSCIKIQQCIPKQEREKAAHTRTEKKKKKKKRRKKNKREEQQRSRHVPTTTQSSRSRTAVEKEYNG